MTWGRRPLAVGAAALALLVGCSGSDPPLADPAPATGSQTPDQTASPQRPDPAAGGLDYRATPLPVRVQIPKIRVASSLDRLGRAQDGTVEVPSRWGVAGWYALGPRPGDPGSAVILGHVDSRRGPAVFFRLRELRRGDEIMVTRADRSSARFVVERTAQYDKQQFPTDDVYYPMLTPALRLVTCGGQFDHSTGHYRSNIIVFATLRT
jgi:sortase (surface protein transpeptidase)